MSDNGNSLCINELNSISQTLLTDDYQLNMAYSYWQQGIHNERARFELFFRKNPFKGEFTIFAGLEDCLYFIKNLRFSDSDIKYVRAKLGYAEPDFFNYLRQFDCSQITLQAIAEGNVVFPKVPLIVVEGPLAVCQFLETPLLNLVNFASLVTTNAARFRLAAGEQTELLEFGLRRAQGPNGGLSASKYCYLGGFDSTSNLLAGKLYGIPVKGTMAHSFVTAFKDQPLHISLLRHKEDGQREVDLQKLAKSKLALLMEKVNPYSAVCNQRAPVLTYLQQFFRRFQQPSQPFVLGGTVFENSDLPPGKYTVVDDIHISPGAKLTLSPGSTLEFMSGVGMLVQGELLRNDLGNPSPQPIIFTSRPRAHPPPRLEQLRLVDEFGNEDALAGRLEVKLEPEGEWGTVCNRSWTGALAQLACNQLGLAIDLENFEHWRLFPEAGDIPILMDNIRCEEREFDLTKCRHDGQGHNVRASCRPTEVVGLRCAPPFWAGVRYSLLANPPTVTGQATMTNWVIERAGLFDFRTAAFSPALQIDWNYHSFHGLTIKDNFHDGMDILYNDLTRKPAIRDSYIGRNRRNGLVVRSMGLSAERLLIEQNGNAGVRYTPRVKKALQKDIVSWLDRQEQPELEANGVILMPGANVDRRQRVQVFQSQLDQRKFLVARLSPECPLTPAKPCKVELDLEAVGHEYGMPPRLVVQLVNRPGPRDLSDEDALFQDRQTNRRWSAREQPLEFPLLASGPRLAMTYTRSYGRPALVLLVLFMDHQEYLDRFLHVYDSVVRDNQYGVSAEHHGNLTLPNQDTNFDADASLVNRYSLEKYWFQRVNFTGNYEAVIWLHSPDYAVAEGTPLAEIGWHVDNCSISGNSGPIVDTRRDAFASANVFHWNFWSNTFANNTGGGIAVHLPDIWNLLAAKTHSFWMTENRFERNREFAVQLGGYYTFANISSNNFTDNRAPAYSGLVHLLGMEKRLVMDRNRMFSNWGHWMIRVEMLSQRLGADQAPGAIQNNYIQHNHFLLPTDEYVDMWPRSYAVGIFGVQKVEVHFNRMRNALMDFELVAGCKPQMPGSELDLLNVTHNWWGVANEAELGQRVFDLDDWNSLSGAMFSPYYTTDELFINFWWTPNRGQLSHAPKMTDPPDHDLRGRLWGHKRLELEPERWYPFPYHFRPFRPYRITRDLTIMPGASLTIDKNVEVHVWPNVRILVYGTLVADGTLWQPIRFKPINATELAEQRGQQGTRYRRQARSPVHAVRRRRRRRSHGPAHLDAEWRMLEWQRWRAKRTLRFPSSFNPPNSPAPVSQMRPGKDDIFQQFPQMRRENPQLQRFLVLLMEKGRMVVDRGFLHFYNATSGEVVPSCDRHFTLRNAQVVCHELGFSPQNAYHWLTPQWDYNPKIRILKTYMEPRECRGNERRLDQCMLRLTGLLSDWQCMANEHFNYVHCGPGSSLSQQYIGHWGGITFARHSLEMGAGQSVAEGGGDKGEEREWNGEQSLLRHVEIVGGGRVHNDSLLGAALQVVRRAPLLENVNVTNCSLHAVQIVLPSSNMVLSRLNISDNHGLGLNLLSASLQSSSGSLPPGGTNSLPRGPLTIPYQLPGLLDICASGKEVQVRGRITLFYKYDSVAVDCVKVFRSLTGRSLGFRFVQANFNRAAVGIPRADSLSVYSGSSFSRSSLLRTFDADSPFHRGGTLPSQSVVLSLHLRATAADGEFGFVAEVATLPTAPLAPKGVDEVAVRLSRLLNNDRGALQYRNVGELGPNVIVEQCVMDRNGYHLFGNISSSMQAAEFHLHNTLLLLFRANSLRHNRGGLFISANSSSPVARLNAVLKSNAIALNSNSTALTLLGNGLQRAVLLNNLIAHNYALYAETMLVNGITANFSRNLVIGNVGWHTLDTLTLAAATGPDRLPSLDSTAQIHLLDNFFEANLALGHGNQYEEKYGFHQELELDEFIGRRPRRQVLTQRGVSFDWWTHVGAETGRFRSTVLAGSAHHKFSRNVFNNPQNDYELVTSPTSAGIEQQQFEDSAALDARHNYWGPPGTVGVAAGKIRDQRDDPSLGRVDFEPVLESNASLIEGDCPPGWFQLGHEEFKSCFLFVGAASTFEDAIRFCQRLDAFMPVLRDGDPRQRELAAQVDQLGQTMVTDVERHNSFGTAFDIPVWVSSVGVPSNQCGWMSSRTAGIGEQNCNNLLPFVCEKGTKPYQEPLLWRRDILLILLLLLLLAIGVALLALCACRKAQRKQEEFPRKKQLIRQSIRRQKRGAGGGGTQTKAKGGNFVPLDAFGPVAGELKGFGDYSDEGMRSSRCSASTDYGEGAPSLLSTDCYARLSSSSSQSASGNTSCPCCRQQQPIADCPNCCLGTTITGGKESRSSLVSSTNESNSSDISTGSDCTLVPLPSVASGRVSSRPPPPVHPQQQGNGSYALRVQQTQSTAQRQFSQPAQGEQPQPGSRLAGSQSNAHILMPEEVQKRQRHFDEGGGSPSQRLMGSQEEMPLPRNRNIAARREGAKSMSPMTLRRPCAADGRGGLSVPRNAERVDPPDLAPTKNSQLNYVNLAASRPRQAPPRVPPKKRSTLEDINPLETSM